MRFVFLVVYSVVLLLGYQWVDALEWNTSAGLHTAMEVLATFLATGVAAMSLLRYYSKSDIEFLLLGVAFAGAAFFDGYHALVTSSYFAPMMPSTLPHLIPWSWLASRFFLAIMLVTTAWVLAYSPRGSIDSRTAQTLVYSISTLFLVLCALFFIFTPLPPAHYMEFYFHRPQELVPGALFALALFMLLRIGLWKRDWFHYFLVLCLITNMIGQVAFMSVSAHIFDYAFDAAHILKKVSYLLTHAGLLISMFLIFKQSEFDKHLLEEEIELRKHVENDLKEAQLRNMQAEKMAALNRFIGGFVHEINNAVMGIYAYFNYIVENPKTESSVTYAKRGLKKAQGLSIISDSLLALTESPPQSESSFTTFEQVLDDALQLHHERISDLQVETEIDQDTSMQTVTIQEGELLRIFDSVIRNALDALEHVDPSERKIMIKIRELANQIEFAISDSGKGIDDSITNQIFEPFFSTKLQGEGLGLGLSVAAGLAARASGELTLNTARTSPGAEFILRLPAHSESPALHL